jgi:hypothetical protein
MDYHGIAEIIKALSLCILFGGLWFVVWTYTTLEEKLTRDAFEWEKENFPHDGISEQPEEEED